MKRKNPYIHRLALALLLASSLGFTTACSDKEETDVFASKELSLNMTLTPTVVDLPARNASQDITITSNTAWGAVSDVTWAKLSAASGIANGTLSVTLDDNTSTEPRTATITFQYGNTQQTVTITQAAATATKFEKVQATNIARYQADISGIFSSVFDVTEYGVVYSATVAEPTLEEENANIHQEVISTTPTAQDIVSITIKGLKAGSKNYARIYTKGPLGTEYSQVITFVTSGGAPDAGDNPTPGY